MERNNLKKSFRPERTNVVVFVIIIIIITLRDDTEDKIADKNTRGSRFSTNKLSVNLPRGNWLAQL